MGRRSLAVNEIALVGLVFLVGPLRAQAAGIIAGSVVGYVGNSRVTFAETLSRPEPG